MERHLARWTLAAAALVGCSSTSSAVAEVDVAAVRAPVCDPGQPAGLKFAVSPGGTPEVGPADVLAQRCHVRIIDVREREELGGALGMVEGAHHIPQRRVMSEALSWDREEPVVIVCRSGRRSGAVARELRQLGFAQVASMTGGMLGWRSHGFPTVDGVTNPPPAAPAMPPPTMRSATRQAVADHIADRNRVRWTKAATLLLHGNQACVDGRDAHAIIGTPGGDAGELVLALATAERLSGRPFSRDDVQRIFDAYLKAFGQFYMHSDEHAVAAWVDRVRAEQPNATLPDAHDPDATIRLVERPPPDLRAAMLRHVAEPAHVGCGHLRLMLQQPDEYGVRPGLVADVLRAFYRRMWDQHPAVEFVVLAGTHEESAVVTVELESEVHAYTRIPLVSPRLADSEVFVAHPQVARYIRRENAAFLLEEVPLLHAGNLDESAFLGTLEALAQRQLDATLSNLAPTLPRFRVRFTGDAFDVVGPLPAADNPKARGNP